MKKILIFMLAALLAVSAVGCGKAKNEEKTVNDPENKVEEKVDAKDNDGETQEASDTAENNDRGTLPNDSTDTAPTDNTDNASENTEVTSPKEENKDTGNEDNATKADNAEKEDDKKTDIPATEKPESPSDTKDDNQAKPEDVKKPENTKPEVPAQKPEDKKPEEKPAGPTTSSLGIEIPAVSNQTVIDSDVCSVKVTGIKDDSIFGPTLCIELENKSTDTAYIFSINDSYVNGVYTPMYLYSEVPAGKKSSEEFSLSLESLIKYGITKITDIELVVEVKSSNASWIDPPVVLETVNITPYGKNSAKKFVVGADKVQHVYVDNKYVKISALSYYKSEIYGHCIDLFIENRSDSNISVKFENTTVNGKLIDPYVYEVVNKGKNSIALVDWTDTEFKDNGIDGFKDLKFTIVVANNDDVSGKNYSADEITLSFGA